MTAPPHFYCWSWCGVLRVWCGWRRKRAVFWRLVQGCGKIWASFIAYSHSHPILTLTLLTVWAKGDRLIASIPLPLTAALTKTLPWSCGPAPTDSPSAFPSIFTQTERDTSFRPGSFWVSKWRSSSTTASRAVPTGIFCAFLHGWLFLWLGDSANWRSHCLLSSAFSSLTGSPRSDPAFPSRSRVVPYSWGQRRAVWTAIPAIWHGTAWEVNALLGWGFVSWGGRELDLLFFVVIWRSIVLGCPFWRWANNCGVGWERVGLSGIVILPRSCLLGRDGVRRVSWGCTCWAVVPDSYYSFKLAILIHQPNNNKLHV